MDFTSDLVTIKGTREEVEEKLEKLSDPNCRKCYGRGYTGFNLTNKSFLACPKCIMRRKKAA